MCIFSFFKNLSPESILTLSAAWLGVVAAWVPFFIEKITRREIHVKVLSIFGQPGMEYADKTSGHHFAKGMIYCLKMTFFTNKDLIIQKLSVQLKFKIFDDIKNGIVFTDRGFKRKEIDKDGKPVEYLINVPVTDYIQNKPFYKKNEAYAVYLVFIVNDPEGKIKTLQDFEYLEMALETPSRKKITKRIHPSDINPNDVIRADYNDFIKIETKPNPRI